MIKIALSLLALLICTQVIRAQKPTDTELWTGVHIDLKWNKTFRTYIEDQFRFNDTLTSLKNNFAEGGLRYKMNQRIALKGACRFILRPGKKNRYRFALDAYYKWNKKKFPLSVQYRFRMQNTHTLISGKNKTYLRNKLGLHYKLSKWVDPVLSYELYFRFNQKNEFRRVRYTMGLDWKLYRGLFLYSFFRIQDDIRMKAPGRQYILGCMLTYHLK